MLGPNLPTFLLASPQPALLARVERALEGMGARVEIVLSAPAALAAMMRPNPPDLALVDAALPGIEAAQLLAAARAQDSRFPLVMIVDAVTQEWLDRLAEGVVDDLILRDSETSYWEVRAERALRAHRLGYELDTLREAAALEAQRDRLTGVLNRAALLAALFRETDRAQRMNTALSLILFDVDDFGHWNSRLGVDACDELLCQVVARTAPLLRSYDLLGRTGKDDFLVALPGCAAPNAYMLAERLRLDVFSEPYRVTGEAVRLSACFGIAQSLGRSPVVVLREAEQALIQAQKIGPESIHCFGGAAENPPPPVTFLSPTSGKNLLAW